MNSFLKRFILRQEKTFFTTARRYFFPGGVVYVRKETGLSDSFTTTDDQKSSTTWYYTVLVSKKTAPLATQRNLIKRIGKEAFREVIRSIQETRPNSVNNQQTNYKVVLLLKKKPEYTAIVNELQKILRTL